MAIFRITTADSVFTNAIANAFNLDSLSADTFDPGAFLISDGAGNDIIYGTAAANVLNGGNGNDFLFGFAARIL